MLPRPLLAALLAAAPLAPALLACDDGDLPPSSGKGSPSALPTIWGFNSSQPNSKQDRCDKALVNQQNCGAVFGNWTAFCPSAPDACVQCFLDNPCVQFGTCFNLCSNSFGGGEGIPTSGGGPLGGQLNDSSGGRPPTTK